MTTGKVRELTEEFRTVFVGRSNMADSIVPPILFVAINALAGLQYAVWSSLAVALLITVVRLVRRDPIRNALGGFGAVLLAVLVARLLGRAEGYLLPAIVTGGLTFVVCVVSVLAGRPMVAWTSHLARRWPLRWYWHPRVRPAYDEVTWMWALFFATRWALQLALFQGAAPGFLAIANVAMGWPATIVLLAVSYLYGTWRLRGLRGPSVKEYKEGAEPPWTGQSRGF
jgi:hypothetical protein